MPEQLNICQRVVRSIANLPEDQCASVHRIPVSEAVAAASASHARVQSLKSALRAEVTNRKGLLRTARELVTGAAQFAQYTSGSSPRLFFS